MRADRLIAILLLLQVHGRMTARSLAERLEVSERTVLRDMQALGTAGVPVTSERGPGGGWRLAERYETKLNGLSAAEIQALFFARPPRLLADLGLGRAAEAAWLKLEAALPRASQPAAELARRSVLIDPRGWREAEAVTCLPVLLDALWRGRRVGFVYDGALGEPGERRVDPLGLVARGGTWYLVARRDAELRTYRVSRMRSACVLDEPSERPAGFDLAGYWEQSAAALRERLPQHRVTVLAEPSVLRWARYRGSRIEEQRPQGDRVRLRLRFDSAEEALQFALSFGGDVEVIEPAELRAQVVSAARATIERHGAHAVDVRRCDARSNTMTARQAQTMAAYNRWMNERLYAVCADMTDAERKQDRERTDAEIEAWIATLTDEALAATFEFATVFQPASYRCPLWVVVAHFFNHQTHHRGQVTALLSQCGKDYGVTDLLRLPGALTQQ